MKKSDIIELILYIVATLITMCIGILLSYIIMFYLVELIKVILIALVAILVYRVLKIINEG